MLKINSYLLDFAVDSLTDSILNRISKLSFQIGGEGFVSFESKTKLIDHYVKTLGAYHFGGHLMVIDPIAANRLVDKYFKQ
jgi:hypothetical protein